MEARRPAAFGVNAALGLGEDEALCVFYLRHHILVLCQKYVKNRNRRISSLVLGISSRRSPSGFVRSDRIVLSRPCLVGSEWSPPVPVDGRS